MGRTLGSRARTDGLIGRSLPALLLLNVVTVAWMTAVGDRLGEHGLLAVFTLGGHPDLVTVLATASFVILAALAATVEDIGRVSAPARLLFAVAAVATVIATAGLACVVLLVVLGGSFVGLLIKLSR
ncbi:hypothetical protein LWF15_27490 [Kineosporia rhizophila]|uniref:hypothetical protein n=1 Tax=Kineosporia rhizophila TaxID=84633 RepID=UPI000B2A4647|nr:hypothetical protein [Kineosporia rhizophila]MCE0539248.1 hypothetical protein [Kineosporia rhizophila]